MPNPTCPHCGVTIEEHGATECMDLWIEKLWGFCGEPSIDDDDANTLVNLVTRETQSYDFRVNTWGSTVFREYSARFGTTNYVRALTRPLAICRAAVMAAVEEKGNTHE